MTGGGGSSDKPGHWTKREGGAHYKFFSRKKNRGSRIPSATAGTEVVAVANGSLLPSFLKTNTFIEYVTND